MRGRANAVWLVVLAVEFVHGTLPWIFLRPRVGDFRSGQIGVLTGSALFLVIVFLRAVDDAAKLRGLLARGTAVGRPDARLRVESGVTSRGVRPESIAAECNLSHGELMAVGLAIFAMTPWIAWRLRRASANHRRKTGLRDGLLLEFHRLAWEGGKSGVKPPHSRGPWEMLWHFGRG